MKLTFDQIKSAALGSVLTEEENGLIRFHRFTAPQAAVYTRRESLAPFATSGVKLSFLTDSATFSFKAVTEKVHSSTFFTVDVFVNGSYFGSYKNFDESEMPLNYTKTPFPLGECEGFFDLPEGEKEILIYLPWDVDFRLKEVSLSDGASFSPNRPAKKLLCFGDSITQGFHSLYSFRRYPARLAAYLGMEEYCKAVGGEKFQPELGALRDDFTPDLITVAYGTNDWSHRTWEELEANCRGFFENLVKNYPETPVLVLAPIWRRIWQKEKPAGPFRNVCKLLSEIADQYENLTLVDAFDFVPHYLDYFADLSLHPNCVGFDRYFEGIRDFIEKNGLTF